LFQSFLVFIYLLTKQTYNNQDKHKKPKIYSTQETPKTNLTKPN